MHRPLTVRSYFLELDSDSVWGQETNEEEFSRLGQKQADSRGSAKALVKILLGIGGRRAKLCSAPI